MTGPVLFSYTLSGPDKGRKLDGPAISKALEASYLAWAHLDATHPETRAWLTATLPYIDRHAISALLADETRPRATVIGDGMLVILRGVNLNEGADPDDMVSLRLWIDANRIVSMRRRRVFAVSDIEERMQAGTGPETAGQFLALLTDRLAERMEPVLSSADEAADALEENLLASADPGLRRPITDLRRRAIRLRRHIAPQREAVSTIRAADLTWIDAMNHRRLTEVQDRLTRFVEELDAIRERSQIVKDELANALADRLNRNTYVLSVIAAIFLPLGFLTGLLGINVGGIPGADNPSAFGLFSGFLAILVVVQIAIFRWLRWF